MAFYRSCAVPIDARQHDILQRLEQLVGRLETLLAPPAAEPSKWDATGYRWHKRNGHYGFEPIALTATHRLDDLLGIARQKAILVANTEQFLHKLPCNHALLWGARGTGKSTLVHALLNQYKEAGLRVIEVGLEDLVELPVLIGHLRARPERFILFVDDISFSAADMSYRALKGAVEGSLNRLSDNVLIYATSNRRHLLPEHHSDNLESELVDGEIHHGDVVEEKVSLSERFGLWLAFHPFSQEQYLQIVAHWLHRLGEMPMTESLRTRALQWALARGGRGGRVAVQFARNEIGAAALAQL